MRVFIIGTALQELPEMPPDVDEVWLTYPGDDNILRWALDAYVSVMLVSTNPAKIPEDILDEVADVHKATDPQQHLIDETMTEDVVLLAWDDSEEMHATLAALSAKGIMTQDLNDGFQQLVIQDPLEELLRTITESITKDVLKTVRAEVRDMMQDLTRGRRIRTNKE